MHSMRCDCDRHCSGAESGAISCVVQHSLLLERCRRITTISCCFIIASIIIIIIIITATTQTDRHQLTHTRCFHLSLSLSPYVCVCVCVCVSGAFTDRFPVLRQLLRERTYYSYS